MKKLAIAGAILIVGIGTALILRREEAAPGHSADKSATAGTAAAGTAALPAVGNDARPPESGQPKLAGRIEPYAGWNDAPTADRHHVTAEAADKLGPAGPATESAFETIRTASQMAVGDTRPAESPMAAGGRPFNGDYPRADSSASSASFAAGKGEAAHLAGSPLKWQTVQRPNRASRAPAPDKRHRIIDGDTLAGIAERYWGNAQRQRDLFEYNRDVLATPDLLPIGKELRIPPADFVAPSVPLEPQTSGLTAVAGVAARPAGAADPFRNLPRGPAPSAALPQAQTYVVQPHDTLPLIARKLYGSIDRQAELITANRQQLRSAKDLRPGMTLFVPAKNGAR